ncbi:MAG TPA: M23 family metallopeptidase [Mycobacteriales bacterium]
MSIGEVQARIGAIESQLSALAARTAALPGTTAAAGTSSATAPASGTEASSGTSFAAALDSAVNAGASFVKPLAGRVTSEFGPRWGTMHKGLDLAAAAGSPIRAVTGGTVRRADWNGGYGNAVVIDHGNGLSTLYGHAASLNVKPGQRVNAGDIIAKEGSTGDSTGPHLHFEVRINDKQIDPRPWLTARGIKL